MKALRRPGLLDFLVAVGLGAAALGLYITTLAPTVLFGDGGEFQFVPYLLGIAHPTGYPLYCLLGWAWSRLVPLGDVAYRMNLFSAFWAAAAVALLYPTALALLSQAAPELPRLVRRLLAGLGAATLAVTPTLWSQAVMAEVYGLHAFLLVLLLYLLLAWGQRREPHLLLLAALCLGLGLAHHSTTVLWVPATLAYVCLEGRAGRGSGTGHGKRRMTFMFSVLAAVALPLLLYLYIPLRAPHTPYLHLRLTDERQLVLYENTLANLIDFVAGGPFGGSVDLSVDLGQRLTMAGAFLLDEVGWPGVVLASLGLLRLLLGRRWPLVALTGLAYAAVVAFNLVYTIGDIYVLFIPSYLVVVMWMVVGTGALASVAMRAGAPEPASEPSRAAAPSRRRLLAALVTVPFFLLPAWLATANYAAVDRSGDTGARDGWEVLLSGPVPQDAVLVSNDRNDMMPMWYFQYIEGQRPDLLGLFPLITPEYPDLGSVLGLGLSTGRPLYLVKEMPGIEVKVEVRDAVSLGEARLWPVTGPAVQGEPEYPLQGRLEGALALTGYARSPRSPRPEQDLEVSLYWQVLQPLAREYHSFVHLVDGEDGIVAQSDHRPGGVYYPTTLWRPGERLRDEHTLLVPADTPPSVYRLLAGMYALEGDGSLEPLGQPLLLGQVAVKGLVGVERGEIEHETAAAFGGQIALEGYDAAQKAGDLAITLHWRCWAPPPADYTVFVHLLDAGGEIVAQHEGQPTGGAYPTSVWDAGDMVVDEHRLPVSGGLDAASYRLRIGLYLLETGERLPVVGGGDSVELDLDLPPAEGS